MMSRFLVDSCIHQHKEYGYWPTGTVLHGLCRPLAVYVPHAMVRTPKALSLSKVTARDGNGVLQRAHLPLAFEKQGVDRLNEFHAAFDLGEVESHCMAVERLRGRNKRCAIHNKHQDTWNWTHTIWNFA